MKRLIVVLSIVLLLFVFTSCDSSFFKNTNTEFEKKIDGTWYRNNSSTTYTFSFNSNSKTFSYTVTSNGETRGYSYGSYKITYNTDSSSSSTSYYYELVLYPKGEQTSNLTIEFETSDRLKIGGYSYSKQE